MRRISSAKRYAQASFELALEKNELESWQESLREIVDLTRDEELMALLLNPRLPFDAKKNLLQKVLGEINPLACNLAFLLVSKGILRLSKDISQQYNDLLDAHRGIERAKVTTAFPLGDEESKVISRRLGEIVERNVVMDAHIDASIIGGFIARMGDRLIDGSIHQKLESLKERLVQVGR